jgi:hypothetical protein
MTTTTFVDQQTVIVAAWLNDVNTATYTTIPGITATLATKAAIGANTDITSLGGLTTPLSQGQGGTGSATSAGARSNLGAAASGLATASGLTQSTNKILGRTTAATGAIEEISIGSGLSLSAGSLTSSAKQLQTITATVAANALTIGLSASTFDFRSATLGDGTVTTISNSALSLIVPSSATLGTINAIQSRLIVLAINNAGTTELAVVNLSGGTDLSETGVISTTAISAAATSASVIYSTTARTNVAYRVVGYIESTQATAGTWATAPSTIQGCGGQALIVMSSLGFGQVYATQTRISGTTYYNTTGKTRTCIFVYSDSVGAATFGCTVGGVTVVGTNSPSAGVASSTTVLVPPYSAYVPTVTGSGTTTLICRELN